METAAVRHPLLFAALAALLAGGCMPATRERGPDGQVAAAGRAMPALDAPRRAPSPAAVTLSEAYTPSVALDRIDQHALPLDHTYRHLGTGRDVAIYVFDGGVLDSHPQLAGRVRHGFDAFPGDEHLCNAHGTAVAGAAAGTTLGVAPEAEVVDVKMVECRRMRGSIDAIVRAAHWVLADHARHPGQRAVANWSFIADTAAAIPALDTAVAQLRAAGIPVVVSAGNVELDACRISPANAPGVIVVGASHVAAGSPRREEARTFMDARAPHTAYGACIDVFAPGDSVLLPGMDALGGPIEQLWTGTSMSAGYVSGAAALFLEANPSASADDVREHIARTSTWSLVDERSPRAGMLYVGTGTAPRVTAAR